MNSTRNLITALATILFLVVGGVAILSFLRRSSGAPTTAGASAIPVESHEVVVGVFAGVGDFGSPHRLASVRVWSNAAGGLQYEVEGPHGKSSMNTPFSARSGWMMCWDDADQLWVYNPDESPLYCSVHYWFNRSGSRTTGIRNCGELGGWDGIPEEFLAKLPAPARATYEQAQQHQQGIAADSAAESIQAP